MSAIDIFLDGFREAQSKESGRIIRAFVPLRMAADIQDELEYISGNEMKQDDPHPVLQGVEIVPSWGHVVRYECAPAEIPGASLGFNSSLGFIDDDWETG